MTELLNQFLLAPTLLLISLTIICLAITESKATSKPHSFVNPVIEEEEELEEIDISVLPPLESNDLEMSADCSGIDFTIQTENLDETEDYSSINSLNFTKPLQEPHWSKLSQKEAARLAKELGIRQSVNGKRKRIAWLRKEVKAAYQSQTSDYQSQLLSLLAS